MPEPGAEPGPPEGEHAGPAQEIKRRIRAEGPLSFAEFMEVALYWPHGGYYTTGTPVWGVSGDYLTSLDLSPAFSRTIAKEVARMWAALDRPPAFELIEAGAGRGWLTEGILSALKDFCPELYGLVRARVVEVGPAPRQAPAGRVTWHGSLAELKYAPYGCVLSNELIDSFPVHRVFMKDGELKEVYTGLKDDRFVDVLGPPSTGLLPEYFISLGIALAEGQAAEVNLKAPEWLKEAAGAIGAGFVLTIDYGLPARELYSPERAGTLLCHHRHKINDDPYARVGAQDITTHVDFTTMVEAGREVGLELTGFTTQKNFLLGAGILDDLVQAGDDDDVVPEDVARNRALGELIMPGGMGDTFKVLVQHKGVQAPGLKGFTFKDLSAYL